jgi:hypothetical protein
MMDNCFPAVKMRSSTLHDQAEAAIAAAWREACRHIEIDASLSSIAREVSSAMHLRGLVVLKPDDATRSIETIASGGDDRTFEPAARGPSLTPTAWQRLNRWLRSDDATARVDGPASEWLRGSLPSGIDRSALLGALRVEHGHTSLLVAVATAGHRFADSEMAMPAFTSSGHSARLPKPTGRRSSRGLVDRISTRMSSGHGRA